MPRIEKEQKNRARQLRAIPTDAERKLWTLLRRKRMQGWHFRRQHPIPPYFADFVCLAAKLVIEADGGQHDAEGSDRTRDAAIRMKGWRILRFANQDILKNPENVNDAILAELGPLPNPPPLRGGGKSI